MTLSFLRLVATCIILTCAAISAVPAEQSAQDFRDRSARSIDKMLQDFTAEWIRHDPNLARRTRYFAGEEQERLERQLTPWTDAWQRGRIQLARRGLAELQGFDRASMSDSQRLSADLMQWQLQIVVDEEPFLDFTYPLEQRRGANVTLVQTLVQRRLVTERDAENYVAVLAQVAERLEEAAAESRRRAAKGILPPKFILRATIDQMQRFVAPPPAENPFVATFAERMSVFAALSGEKRARLLAQAEQIVQAEIYPAWKRTIALLESQMSRATEDAGLWRLNGGAAAYAFFLRRNTTTNMTPDQIHELGLRQVEAIEKKMDQLFRLLGRAEGSVRDRVRDIRQSLSYPNPASDESRAQIIRDAGIILRDAQERAALFFDKMPKAPVVIRPVSRFLEANTAPNYVPPTSADGSRPGTIRLPLRKERMTKFGLRSLIYHEGVPGHHFDNALRVENKDLPAFRRLRIFGGIPARGEGWGLYSEHLAAEMGWYGEDHEGLLGQLAAQLFRARRLVVDTGLHTKQWTRQQAIDYGIEAAEVERYIVNPGQATAYMIGQLKIIELREKAKAALGAKFSLKAFHNMVLDTGSVPLELLERQTDALIAREQGKN